MRLGVRGFVRWLNYRDAVLQNLNALLLLYPPKRQFGDDFPELKSVIRGQFDAGVSAPSSALQIAGRMIGDFIRQLDDGERAAVLEALVRAGRQGFAGIAERRVKGEREMARDRAGFVAQLTGGAIYMAARMAEEGGLSRDDYAAFLARLGVALGTDAARQQELTESFALSLPASTWQSQ